MSKLPRLTADSFADWDGVSVARAIEYSQTISLAQYLEHRENYDPELTPGEINKFQKLLYSECLSPEERKDLTFDEFVGKHKKASKK